MLLTDVCTVPPVAAATLLRSSSATRPAQKMSLSAKYCFKLNYFLIYMEVYKSNKILTF